ncbi:MAG: potassium transporter TrkG, partial [Clostridia bacterium]|nr:potassium transporter TrkG [Clostridia bacterium]
MNYRLVASLVSYIMLLAACLMSAPMAVAVFTETQTTYLAFAVTIALLIIFAAPSAFVFKPKDKSIYAKDAFVVVAGAWFVLAFFGSLPYFISGLMGGFVDCLFESVSGFTTTGATMLTEVESLPASLLLWRSMTHWIGGLGILLFLLAIISFSGG